MECPAKINILALGSSVMARDGLPIALSPILTTTVNEVRMEEDDIPCFHFRIHFGVYFFIWDLHSAPVTFVDTFFPLRIPMLNEIEFVSARIEDETSIFSGDILH